MIDAPLALAFAAGLVASVNPCGFAMLPAFLSFYLGTDNQVHPDTPLAARLARALSVGIRVSASFLVVFGAAGILITAGVRSFIDYVPWVAIVIGLALAGLGVAMVAGKSLNLRLPVRSTRRTTVRSTADMVAFGLSYAVTSLSCTLPVFLAVVGTTFARADLATGAATFAAYALGMTTVLLTIAISLALAQHTIVARLRSMSRHLHRIAGVLLIAAGAYITYYWVFRLSTEPGEPTGAGPARFVEALSSDITNWMNNLGWPVVAGVLGTVIAITAVYILYRRRGRSSRISVR